MGERIAVQRFRPALRQDWLDHLAMNVGQPEVTSCIAESEFVVLKTQQMQQRRMQVVHMHTIHFRAKSKLVRRAVNRTALDASTSQPHRESIGIVIPPRRARV